MADFEVHFKEGSIDPSDPRYLSPAREDEDPCEAPSPPINRGAVRGARLFCDRALDHFDDCAAHGPTLNQIARWPRQGRGSQWLTNLSERLGLWSLGTFPAAMREMVRKDREQVVEAVARCLESPEAEGEIGVVGSIAAEYIRSLLAPPAPKGRAMGRSPFSSEVTELPPVDIRYQPLWTEGTRARCIRDDPPMRGFGRPLKVGDTVTVEGVTWSGRYELSVPAECAFYAMEGYFEVDAEGKNDG
jgi:hypothetical protein